MHPQQTDRDTATSPAAPYEENRPITPIDQTKTPPEKYHLTILSHNVRGAKEIKDVDGTQTNTKFEYIALMMDEKNIDVYLIQETWLEGDIDHWTITGITFFTHGPEKQNSSRGRGGLAIGLSKKSNESLDKSRKKGINQTRSNGRYH